MGESLAAKGGRHPAAEAVGGRQRRRNRLGHHRESIVCGAGGAGIQPAGPSTTGCRPRIRRAAYRWGLSLASAWARVSNSLTPSLGAHSVTYSQSIALLIAIRVVMSAH